ncbi:MAG: crossover junction endodeoxyribonuclease RuvC [Deltaproteobacteria bacterium]|nr:crossover junction endodeoxyribonuclease RuvC [Deltaproteobacteria bacterium]
MLILGIDPGSQITGFGLIKKSGQRNTHIENGTFYLREKTSYADRLVCLYKEIQNIIAAYQPEVIAVENIFYHKNPKSIQKLGEVRGVAILSGAISGLKVFEYAPLEVKKAVTGYGGATKSQMQYMVMKLLGLNDVPEENASDALGVALCHAHSFNQLTNPSGLAKTRLSDAKEILKKASFYR